MARDYIIPARFNPASLKAQDMDLADSESGFSLLEVLAVLIIIGLMSAAVVLSMRGPDTGEDFAGDFVLRVNQFAKESIYTGQVNALSISEDGLHLMSYVNRDWITRHEVPFEGKVDARLLIEDETVDIPEAPAPLILFEPTGEVTDFELTVDSFGLPLSLFRSDDGSIQLGVPSDG